jgi:hypothetical protein
MGGGQACLALALAQLLGKVDKGLPRNALLEELAHLPRDVLCDPTAQSMRLWLDRAPWRLGLLATTQVALPTGRVVCDKLLPGVLHAQEGAGHRPLIPGTAVPSKFKCTLRGSGSGRARGQR